MADEPSDAFSELVDARIAALQAELAVVRAEMQHFTYAVSHDLRAPLRHIVSYAQLVEEDAGPQLNEEVRGFLSTITDSARNMGVLLDGLAALARVGTAPVELVSVSLQDLLGPMCSELSAQNPQRAIDWRIDQDLPRVLADEALLRQAVNHVLDNSLKFSALCERAVIEVRTAPADEVGCVVLSIQDNGVGYNPTQQAQLFKVFGRLHSSKQFGGIGMGLVLTQKMLERFGAAVSTQGAVDGGCCVRLLLKRA